MADKDKLRIFCIVKLHDLIKKSVEKLFFAWKSEDFKFHFLHSLIF